MTVLRSADHCRSLGVGMWDLRKAGRLVDIAIHCHGHSTRAHRIVLSVFSPVLRASLVPSLDGCATGHVMPDALPTCLCLDDAVERALDLEILLEFLYRGEVVLPESGLQSLLRTAKFLQIGCLVDAIQTASMTNNSVEYVTIKAEPSHDSIEEAKMKYVRRPSTEVMVDVESFPSTSSICPSKDHVMNHSAGSYYAVHANVSHRMDPQMLLDGQSEYMSDGQAEEFEASDENIDSNNADNADDDAEFDFEDYGDCDQEELPLGDEQQHQHQHQQHQQQQTSGENTLAKPSKKRRFKCKQTCNKIFYSRRGYMAHVKSHAVPARCHKCPICGFMTGQKWTLINHLAIIHKKSTSSNKVFTMISPAVISNEKAREYLAEAETGRLDEFVNDVPAIKPNGGEILLFKTSNKTDDCNYLRDGYNFWQLGNRVTKELGLRRIYFKLHRGSRQFAEGFSRYVFRLTAPANEHNQYVLVHYVGDESVYEPVSHGNTKELRTARATQLNKSTTVAEQEPAEASNEPMPLSSSSSTTFNAPTSQLPFATTMTQLH